MRLAYNGTHFLGSQIQSESPLTIFGTLQRVLAKLGIEYRVVASGRTDRGVHATGQVCHLELPPYWSDLKRLKSTLNEMLPSSIRIKKIVAVADDFHARYSAKKRTYRYILKAEESNPFEAEFVTFIKELDLQALSRKIKLFEGRHDFAEFMKTGSDTKSSIRRVYSSSVYSYKGYTILRFEADGFLRSQIRLMVGALLTLNAEQIVEKLQRRANHKLRPAPPNGLYLAKILY